MFAGTEDRELEPRMAIEYTATTAPDDGRWHFVADANTGVVLHVDNLVSYDYDTITGTVTGNVTSGGAAMECGPAVPTPLLDAEVDCSAAQSTFTGLDGSYALIGDFSSPVSVTSPLSGMRFFVTNNAGPVESLTSTVVQPAVTADFLHNAANVDVELLAQTNAYVQATQIRNFLLKVMPNYPTIATQTGFEMRVNLTSADWGYCPNNGGYWGPYIGLCKEVPGSAPNDAFGDVIHHEFGHHIVAMGGSGQGQYGEGMSDCVAMLYSGKSALALGFYQNCNSPLRDAANACQYDPNYCSNCGSDSHNCGMLLSGTV